MPQHHVLPLNVTRGLALQHEAMLRCFAGERLALLRRFCTKANKPSPTGMHDPLTCACLFAPTLCSWQRGTVGVELSDTEYGRGTKLPGQKQTGRTVFTAHPEGPHHVAVARDPDAFHAHLAEVMAAAR